MRRVAQVDTLVSCKAWIWGQPDAIAHAFIHCTALLLPRATGIGLSREDKSEQAVSL